MLIKLEKNISLIWRNKSKVNDKLEIIKTSEFCKKNNFDFYISNNIRLAIKLKLKGVYISANNYKLVYNYNGLFKDFKIIGSAHNLKEIRIKEHQGVSKIFLSPIFKKKRNNQLGIFRYLSLRKLSSMEDIALGGINSENIKKLYLIKPFGFAGISFFT